jgi:hypothetical protein
MRPLRKATPVISWLSSTGNSNQAVYPLGPGPAVRPDSVNAFIQTREKFARWMNLRTGPLQVSPANKIQSDRATMLDAAPLFS